MAPARYGSSARSSRPDCPSQPNPPILPYQGGHPRYDPVRHVTAAWATMSPGGARPGAVAYLLAPALGGVSPSGEGDPSVAWYRVDSRFLRQTAPDCQAVAYVSHGERDTGNLTLYVDTDHEVA